MYSHELQTCDWPRNVGCEAPEESVSQSTGRDLSSGRQHDAYQVVPSKFRFSSISSTTAQAERYSEPIQVRAPVQAQSSAQQQQPSQFQQTLPPPPELRIAPNPVITSRGQPKPFENVDIAKVNGRNLFIFK